MFTRIKITDPSLHELKPVNFTLLGLQQPKQTGSIIKTNPASTKQREITPKVPNSLHYARISYAKTSSDEMINIFHKTTYTRSLRALIHASTPKSLKPHFTGPPKQAITRSSIIIPTN